MRVLITAGGTEEPVDGVRRLTNSSTGATGGVIARRFASLGARVLLLHAERAVCDTVPVARETFVTFDDLAAALERHLGDTTWDAVIHLAAVSDYSVAAVEVDGRNHGPGGKIPSGAEVVIRLAPNPKLIDRLRGWSKNPTIRVVGFKLTDDADPNGRHRRVRMLLERRVADIIVHNDLSDITADRHHAEIWSADGPVGRTETKEELADALWRLLEHLPHPETTS